jgi:predicted dinucleotide-binding enzyme
MRIGVIGAGRIGATVGRLWVEVGHEVRFGSREPSRLGQVIETLGQRASAGTVAEAADFGEVVLCAAPYGAWPELASQIAGSLAGKVVLDAANPYPPRDGAFAREAIEAGEGAGVPVARLLHGARLVRAFSTVEAGALGRGAHREGDRIGIPLAGDDAQALEIAAALVGDAGFAPVIVGPLARAREFDPGTPVYNTGMSGRELAAALVGARQS